MKDVWDDAAFTRVFLESEDALVWWRQNSLLGTPAQPYHYERFTERSVMRARTRISQHADFCVVQAELAMAALAMQHHECAVELGR